jgi:multidrug efflux pump subunit AcrB
VLLSLLFALTLIPLLSQRFLTPERHRATAESFIGPVNRAYEKAVRWSLRKRWVVAAATLASIATAVFLYTRAETGFLPDMDEGGFVLDTWTSPGTSLAETDRIFQLVGDQVHRTPETEAFLRRTGAEMGPFATTQNTGEIVVKLKPRSRRDRSIDETMDDLRKTILTKIPGVRVEFTQVLQDMIGDMEGTPTPLR